MSSCLFCGLGKGPYCCTGCEHHHGTLVSMTQSSGSGITEADRELTTGFDTGLGLITKFVEHLNAPARPGDPDNEKAVKQMVAERLSATVKLLNIGQGGFEQAESVIKLAADTLRSVAATYLTSPDASVRQKAEFPNRLAGSLDTLIETRTTEKRNRQAEESNKRAKPAPAQPAPPPPAAAGVVAEPDIVHLPPSVIETAGAPSEQQRLLIEIEALAARPEPYNTKLASIEKKRKSTGDALDPLVASMPNSLYRNLLDAVRNIAVAAASAVDNTEDKLGKGGVVDKNIEKAGKALSSILVELSDTYGDTLNSVIWRSFTGSLELGAPVVNGVAQSTRQGSIPVAGPNRQSLDPLENETEENVREVIVYYFPLGLQLITEYYAALRDDQWRRLVSYVRNTPRAERNEKWLQPIYKGIVPGARGWIAPALNRWRRVRGAWVTQQPNQIEAWKAVLISTRAQQNLYW